MATLKPLINNGSIRVLRNVQSKQALWEIDQEVADPSSTAPGVGLPAAAEGQRYILASNTGALNGAWGSISSVGDGDIVEYDGTDWVVVYDISLFNEGTVNDLNASSFKRWDGSAWASLATSGTVNTSAPISGDGSVGSPISLNDNGVTAAKLEDLPNGSLFIGGAVGTQAFATSSAGDVTLDEISGLTIDAGAVTDAKVATGIDAAKISAGSVSNTEFDFLDGVTSSIQTQLDAKIPNAEKGAANGVATLDANGLIPGTQIPDLAITSVTTVADIAARDALTVGSGQGEIAEGDVVIVTDASADANIVAGAASYIYNGASYSLLKSGDDVLSVNGQNGVVTVNAINELTGDITAGPASGSASAAATISANAVTETKIADDAVTSAKIATDAVGVDALDSASLNLRSAVATNQAFAVDTPVTFTHNWNNINVMVEVIDESTGETVIVNDITRTANTIVIEVAVAATLTVMAREVKADAFVSIA